MPRAAPGKSWTVSSRIGISGSARPPRALVDERARGEAGEPALEARAVGVHVLERERLVALEVALDPLVLGGDVEEGGVDVGRQAGELLLQPRVVVGARLGGAGPR